MLRKNTQTLDRDSVYGVEVPIIHNLTNKIKAKPVIPSYSLLLALIVLIFSFV